MTPTGTDGADWISVEELATWLRISLPTAYSMIKRGDLPGVVRLGRVIRISKEIVLQWAAQGCAPRNTGDSRCP